MQTAELVTLQTKDRLLLNGFWFGPVQPKRVIILTHGLTSNAFANHQLVVPLVDGETAVLTYSNRGSEKVARFKRIDKRKKKGYSSRIIGEAHEVFTDCVYDIQAAVDFAQSRCSTEIILVGHSTGSQKTVYYLSTQKNNPSILGAVLLSPLSDYAGLKKMDPEGKHIRAEKIAEEYVAKGDNHIILPNEVWPFFHDAQRFLSLYTPDSEEELFPYAQPGKKPDALQKIKIPLLIILGSADESRDRPIRTIAQWFRKKLVRKTAHVEIISGAPHGFFKYESKVVRLIGNWMQTL